MDENPAKQQPISAKDDPEVSPSPQSKPKRKRRPPAQPWRKPPGFPKRYLSAYNLFFKQERERLLKAGLCSDSSLSEGGLEGGKVDYMLMKPTLPDPNAPKSNAARKHARSSGIGFANLARIVAKKWKTLPPELKAPFEEVALKDKERYQMEMVVWRAQQEKKKEAEAGGAENGNNQWGAAAQSYSGAYSPIADTTDSRTHRRVEWATPHAKMPPLQSDGRNPGFGSSASKNKAGSTVHIFGSPPYCGPGGNTGAPLTPDRKPSALKPASEGVSPMTISSRRGSDPGYHRANSFDSNGDYLRAGEGYHPEHAHARWEGYEGYMHNPHMSPFTVHYTYGGAEPPGISYYRGEEGYPVPVRHRSLPPTRPVQVYGEPHPRYGMAYQVHMPEYAYSQGYYPHPNNPHTQAKYSPPHHHPPPPHGQQPVVTPYAYGFHPPVPRRYQHEETLQLHASRDDFLVPRDLEASRSQEGDDKKRTKETTTKESKTKASKHEESSLLESSFEHIDTNLDTDTVDFLTTLELE